MSMFTEFPVTLHFDQSNLLYLTNKDSKQKISLSSCLSTQKPEENNGKQHRVNNSNKEYLQNHAEVSGILQAKCNSCRKYSFQSCSLRKVHSFSVSNSVCECVQSKSRDNKKRKLVPNYGIKLCCTHSAKRKKEKIFNLKQKISNKVQ